MKNDRLSRCSFKHVRADLDELLKVSSAVLLVEKFEHSRKRGEKTTIEEGKEECCFPRAQF